MKTNRYKNPYFWIGLIGVILTAMGISPETLTSWDMVVAAAVDLIKNPFLLFSVAIAVLGVFVDPTTKGIKDQKDGTVEYDEEVNEHE